MKSFSFFLTLSKALDKKCLNWNLTSVEDLKLLKKRTLGPASLQNIKRFVYSLVYKQFLELVNVYVFFLKFAKHQKICLFTCKRFLEFVNVYVYFLKFAKHKRFAFLCSLTLSWVCQCSHLLSQNIIRSLYCSLSLSPVCQCSHLLSQNIKRFFYCSLSFSPVCQCSLLLSQTYKTSKYLSLTLNFYFLKPKGLSFSGNSDIP